MDKALALPALVITQVHLANARWILSLATSTELRFSKSVVLSLWFTRVLHSIWAVMYPIFKSVTVVQYITVSSFKLQEYYSLNQWYGDRYLRNRFRDLYERVEDCEVLKIIKKV